MDPEAPSEASGDKTVFISYRRERAELALLVLNDLRANGFDVFLDFDSMGSGDYRQLILQNVARRTHFVVLLTPGCLERCEDPGDLFRLEIEAAIDSRRNIVALAHPTFDFGAPEVRARLVGRLGLLARYNALPLPHPPTPVYLAAALQVLREQYLARRLDDIAHPALLPEATKANPGRGRPRRRAQRVTVPVAVPAGAGRRPGGQPAGFAAPATMADFTGTAIVIVAHEPLATALARSAAVISPERVERLFAVDVPAAADLAAIARELEALLERLAGHPILLLTDIFGATPANLAQRAMAGRAEHVAALCGVNVPMLWRALVYLDLDLQETARRTLAGGQQGVMPLPAARA